MRAAAMRRHYALFSVEALASWTWQEGCDRWSRRVGAHGRQIRPTLWARRSRFSANPLKKRDDGKRLGADYYYATSEPEIFTKLKGYFDLIINTVSANMDWNQYLNLLKVDGSMVIVGIPERQTPIGAFPLAARRRSLAGSLNRRNSRNAGDARFLW